MILDATNVLLCNYFMNLLHPASLSCQSLSKSVRMENTHQNV